MEGTIAEIRMFAANFSPRNWAYCNGQLMNISSNSALFSLLGTTYGGNGIQTFALPDFRGRNPLSAGQGAGLSNYALGQMSGSPSLTLFSSNLPNHTHVPSGSPTVTVTQAANTSPGTLEEAGPSVYPATPSSGELYSPTSDTVWKTFDLAPTSNLSTSASGSNMPITLGSPYLGINYIICMYGIYPSRN